ncbi:DUF4179 domain-containing protein [Pediococcus siamensis]|uniref:DUF4179 domain-containing protein n=1 Tax=Pediococcus siamensis TaxID=381829 RepID=UPI0039A016F0
MKNEKFSRFVNELNKAQKTDSTQTRETIETVLTASGVPQKHHRHRTLWGVIAVAAAFCLLILSGMYITPVNHVMAQVPYVGQFFAQFDDDLGSIVEANGKSQQLNVSRNSSGMKVVLKSAYVQGREVAITGTVRGLEHPRDDWFSCYVKKTGVKFSQNIGDIRKVSKGYYRFYLNGELKGNVSQKTIPFPIIFTSFKGNFGRWAFNLRLAPSKVTTQKLNGNLTLANGDIKLKALGLDEYEGGTGLLRIEETQRYQDDSFDLSGIWVNNGQTDYLLYGDPVYLKKKGKKQIIGYKVKKMPKQIKQLTIQSSLEVAETSPRISLNRIPVTITAKRSHSVYQFSKVTLSKGKLTVRYKLTGIDGSSRSYLHDHDMVSDFVIMAKTYHDNGGDSTFGKYYLDHAHYRLVNTKKHEYEATFDLNKKAGLKNLRLTQLQLQIDFASLHAARELGKATMQITQ